MQFIQWRHQLHRLDSDRLVHSLKTAIALLFGLLISYLFKLPLQGRWVVITILVVMCAQSRVGAILQKSYMRFLGTVIGASVASLTLCVYPNVAFTILILCVATAVFSYIADSPSTWSEAGPLGAVTLIIIVISPDPNFYTVMSRFLEINLGIIIALLVSRFIWPLHSRTQLRYILIDTLQNLKALAQKLEEFTFTNSDDNNTKPQEIFENKILNNIGIQKKLFKEVMSESFGRSNLEKTFKNILDAEREILRCITLMRNTLMDFSDQNILIFNQHSKIQKVYQITQDLFQRSIDSLKSKGEDQIEGLEEFSGWKKEIKLQLNSLEINQSDQFAIDLFIFSADRLLVQLHTLIILIKKV